MASVEFTDHSDSVISRLRGNIRAALTAMGAKAAGLTVGNMESGYGKPIRQTGNLMRDVSYEVENSGENTVDVGNTLEYSVFVHEGTCKMAGRPYLRDAIMNGRDALGQAAAAALRQGME